MSATTAPAAAPAAPAAPAAAAAPAPAAAAAVATFFLASPGGPIVADAKAFLTASYPKLFSRFVFAFQGHEDSAPLGGVVDAIASDVAGWFRSMPDNFKTSSHALSRPKFGLLFVLKDAEVRKSVGEQRCAAAVEAIERAWEECKKAIVVPSVKESKGGADGGAQTAAAAAVKSENDDDDIKLKYDLLSAKFDFLASTHVAMLAKHYDADVANSFETMLLKW
jgi:hypothetical protein